MSANFNHELTLAVRTPNNGKCYVSMCKSDWALVLFPVLPYVYSANFKPLFLHTIAL